MRDGRVFIDSQHYSLDNAEKYIRSKKGMKVKVTVISNDNNFPGHTNESRIIDAIADARLDLSLRIEREVH